MDGTLFKIFHKYNSDGYYIYFRVVEILADGDHLIKPKKNIKEWWEKEIMKSWELIEPVLDLMASEGMIELEKGEEISVLCPNLGILNPEWMRKLQHRESQKTAMDGTRTEQFRNTSVLKENKVKESKVKEKTKDNTSAPVKNPVAIWCEKFKSKFGEQYIATPKDAGHLKRVYKLIPEQFESKIDAFFEVDNFAHEWNVSIFQATLNKIKPKDDFSSKYKLENNPAYIKYCQEKGIKE